MKKTFLLPLLFFQIIGFSQIINIPDINFKTKLLSANVNNQTAGYTVIDLNNNDEIEQSEALQVTYLFLAVSNISDLTGIEYFTNVQYLFINTNLLSSINLSTLNQLIFLRCDSNNLSTLNLNGLNNIEQLQINNNNFTSIDFSVLPNLKLVKCDHNLFTSLDFSNNLLFNELICNNNINLNSINIKNGSMQLIGLASPWQDCWNNGNPNLTNICADTNEVAPLQTFLATCNGIQPVVTSNCGLSSEEFAANKVVLYPNPTSSIITINSNEIIKSIELYDSLSRLLVSKIVESNQSSLDLSNYSNSIYFVKIITDNGEKIEKVLKQ